MSLINDMLKDLDARRPGRWRSQSEILRGLGAVRSTRSRAEGILLGVARLSCGLLLIALTVTVLGGRTGPASMAGGLLRGVDLDSGDLMLAEAIKLLDASPPQVLPDVAQSGPGSTSELGEVRHIVLERRAGHIRLILELSRETTHYIEHDHDLLTLTVMNTRLVDALPELDLGGTPISAIHARQLGEDLSLDLELSRDVRTQSTMLASHGSPRLVLDFNWGGKPGMSMAKAFRTSVFEKRARPPSARELAAQTYQQGLELIRQQNEPGAINLFQDALALDPQYHPAREALASAFLRLGQKEAAEPLLADGLTLAPDHAPFAKLQARALAMRGALSDAVKLLERFQATGVGDVEYHALLAALYQRQGAHARALEHYQLVLRWESDKAVWWMGLGISLEGASKFKEAVAAYRAAAVLGGLGDDSQLYIGERIAALQAEMR